MLLSSTSFQSQTGQQAATHEESKEEDEKFDFEDYNLSKTEKNRL